MRTKLTSDLLISTSRFVLVAGFGGLLVVIALGGFDASRVLRQIRNEDDQIRKQFLFRNHLLNDIRSELYLSGTYVRDYLLDPEPERAATYRTSLEEVRRQMESALLSYGRQEESGDTGHYTALKLELAGYWEVIRPILDWDANQRRQRGYIFLRDDVFPRRAAMLAIAGQIADINEQQLNGGNERVVNLLVTFQKRLAVILFATLTLGLGMAAFSTRKILQLEANAQARFQEVSEARNQLTNLSARLVQAQETERRVLARELHDEVGQSLSAALVELRNLSIGLAAASVEQSRSQVEIVKGLLESTVKVVRNMSLLLRPSMLDDLGLVPALRWQAREASKRTAMDVNVTTELVSDDFPDEHKTCIYRVVQEALHNCSRHSQAATVRIRVVQRDGLLSLSIQDDGCGFDVKHSKGLGLLGIEERVAQLGGTCTIHSASGSGTTLSVALPIHSTDEIEGTHELEADSHSIS
ncbi:MAG: ATP-binding protein [Acidobacteriota bacterium]